VRLDSGRRVYTTSRRSQTASREASYQKMEAGQVCERGKQPESMCNKHEKPHSEQRDKSGNSGGWTSM
jgi:hypothetical protein